MKIVVTYEVLNAVNTGYSVHVMRKSWVLFGFTVWQTVNMVPA